MKKNLRKIRLGAIIEKRSQKRAMYKAKLLDTWDSASGYLPTNNKYCKTCSFAHGKPPLKIPPIKGIV